ncbi:MAG: fibronectin type III domain-containing protein [Eubacterium sp.]|nr:fibronectin type III domain-containing protein [Eubacterium sp.]
MKKVIKSIICLVLALCMLAPMTATAATRLATPKGFKVVTTTTSSVKVKWNKVKGVKYTVQYSAYKNFKKSKKVNVKSNVATIKKLKAKKVYYFRVRAYKKGKKASKYTNVIKAKTVNRLNVDKKLKGNWVGFYSYLCCGDGYRKFSFNGKGKVTVDDCYQGKKTLSYKKLSGNRVSFTVFSQKYTIKCYSDSGLLTVHRSDGFNDVLTKNSGLDINNRSFINNFVNTSWYSPYLNKYYKDQGYKFTKISIKEKYSYGSYSQYASVNCSGYSPSGELNLSIEKKNLALIFDNSGVDCDIVLEKKSAKKMNAFIIRYYYNGIVKETWTAK